MSMILLGERCACGSVIASDDPICGKCGIDTSKPGNSKPIEASNFTNSNNLGTTFAQKKKKK